MLFTPVFCSTMSPARCCGRSGVQLAAVTSRTGRVSCLSRRSPMDAHTKDLEKKLVEAEQMLSLYMSQRASIVLTVPLALWGIMITFEIPQFLIRNLLTQSMTDYTPYINSAIFLIIFVYCTVIYLVSYFRSKNILSEVAKLREERAQAEKQPATSRTIVLLYSQCPCKPGPQSGDCPRCPPKTQP